MDNSALEQARQIQAFEECEGQCGLRHPPPIWKAGLAVVVVNGFLLLGGVVVVVAGTPYFLGRALWEWARIGWRAICRSR